MRVLSVIPLLVSGFISTDENPDTIIEKLPDAGRLLAAVNLQNGYMDDAILKLMGLDRKFSLSDLQKFNKENVEEFVEKLLSVGGLLKSDSEKVEQVFIDFNEIQQFWAQYSDKINRIPGSLKMIEDVNNYDSYELETIDIKEPLDLLNDIIDGRHSDFEHLQLSLQAVISKIEVFSKSHNTKGLQHLLESLSPLEYLVRIIDWLAISPFWELAEYPKGLPANLKSFDLINIKKIPDLEILEAVFNSQAFELKKLNFKESWIKNALWGSNFSETRWILDFQTLIDKFYEPFQEQGSQRDVRKAATFHHRLLEVKSLQISDFEAIAKGIQSCVLHKESASAITNLRTTSKNIQILLKKIRAVRNVEISMVDHKKVVQELSGKTEMTELKQLLNAVLFLKENLRKVIRYVLNWGESAKSIFESLNGFHSLDTTKEVTSYMKCLMKVDGPVEKAASVAMVFKGMRKLRMSFKENLLRASNIMIESLGNIKAIRDCKVEKIHKVADLQNLQTYSESFQNSIPILNTIKEVLAPNNEFLKFIEIGNELKERSNELLKFYDWYFGNFESLQASIANLIDESTVWKNKIRILKGSSLDAYGDILKDLVNINGVEDFQPETILSAIDNFEGFTNDSDISDTLSQLRGSVEKLEGFEMHFSKYHGSLMKIPEDLRKMKEILEGKKGDENPNEALSKRSRYYDLLIILYVAIPVILIFTFIWCLLDTHCPLRKYGQRQYERRRSVRPAKCKYYEK
ncbi:hypothetical protein GCK72_011816 [Caenorhabditis remanei]|uniref:Domain of unknown function WSN domain-containing protein n=1 Tax=Caenorhabditis remanei TaxID=31234 RepID=A0A6A5H6T9_CAERE|nr:hypothetical protein GCK72_011816 [Caenorhabditis remanei]KAF1763550.1 hypothetical protein GCK72_011816 [Caenorhabditis remanei]